jgi:hypothetical protein
VSDGLYVYYVRSGGTAHTAPLSDELLEHLPVGYTVVTRFNDEWLASWAPRADAPDHAVTSNTPANALAELMLLLLRELKKEGHI